MGLAYTKKSFVAETQTQFFPVPTAQPCFSHRSLVFQKKCFPVAGADGGESYTEGHFERVALVHAEGAKSNSL